MTDYNEFKVTGNRYARSNNGVTAGTSNVITVNVARLKAAGLATDKAMQDVEESIRVGKLIDLNNMTTEEIVNSLIS